MLDEKILCAALDLVDMGMAIIDSRQRIEWCNVAYAELLGRSTEEFHGADFFGDARPCNEVLEYEDDWNRDRMFTVSGQSASGPVDVVVRPVVKGSQQRLVVVRRGVVRGNGSRRLPPEVAVELCEFVTDLTGHPADPMVLGAAPLSILVLTIAEHDAIRLSQGDEVLEEVLRQVAQALVLQKRKADIIARFRDGQFLVLAPDTPRSGASMLAERIRKSVEGLDLRVGGHALPVSLLAHSAEYRPHLDGNVREAVEKASNALSALQIAS